MAVTKKVRRNSMRSVNRTKKVSRKGTKRSGKGLRKKVSRKSGKGLRKKISRKSGKGLRKKVSRKSGKGLRKKVSRKSGKGLKKKVSRKSGKGLRKGSNKLRGGVCGFGDGCIEIKYHTLNNIDINYIAKKLEDAKLTKNTKIDGKTIKILKHESMNEMKRVPTIIKIYSYDTGTKMNTELTEDELLQLHHAMYRKLPGDKKKVPEIFDIMSTSLKITAIKKDKKLFFVIKKDNNDSEITVYFTTKQYGTVNAQNQSFTYNAHRGGTYFARVVPKTSSAIDKKAAEIQVFPELNDVLLSFYGLNHFHNIPDSDEKYYRTQRKEYYKVFTEDGDYAIVNAFKRGEYRILYKQSSSKKSEPIFEIENTTNGYKVGRQEGTKIKHEERRSVLVLIGAYPGLFKTPKGTTALPATAGHPAAPAPPPRLAEGPRRQAWTEDEQKQYIRKPFDQIKGKIATPGDYVFIYNSNGFLKLVMYSIEYREPRQYSVHANLDAKENKFYTIQRTKYPEPKSYKNIEELITHKKLTTPKGDLSIPLDDLWRNKKEFIKKEDTAETPFYEGTELEVEERKKNLINQGDFFVTKTNSTTSGYKLIVKTIDETISIRIFIHEDKYSLYENKSGNPEANTIPSLINIHKTTPVTYGTKEILLKTPTGNAPYPLKLHKPEEQQLRAETPFYKGTDASPEKFKELLTEEGDFFVTESSNKPGTYKLIVKHEKEDPWEFRINKYEDYKYSIYSSDHPDYSLTIPGLIYFHRNTPLIHSNFKEPLKLINPKGNVDYPPKLLQTEEEQPLSSDTSESSGDFPIFGYTEYYSVPPKRETREVLFKELELSISSIEDKNSFDRLNRYEELPPKSTRVKLKLEQIGSNKLSTYINANFISGYNSSPNKYIAAMGPLSATIVHFWRMIVENDVKTIVMTTNLTEKGKDKCKQYWPEGLYEIGQNKENTYDDVTVKAIKFEEKEGYKCGTLKINCRKLKKNYEVKHFWYDTWPDHGVPDIDHGGITHVINMLEDVREHQGTDPAPIVVHCSAGIGRTGSFIGIDIGIDTINAGKTVILKQILVQMRNERGGMVQTNAQYKFMYDTLKEYHKNKTKESSV